VFGIGLERYPIISGSSDPYHVNLYLNKAKVIWWFRRRGEI